MSVEFEQGSVNGSIGMRIYIRCIDDEPTNERADVNVFVYFGALVKVVCLGMISNNFCLG